MDLNPTMVTLKRLGRYQAMVFLLLFISGIFHGARMNLYYFIQLEPRHRCAIPGWSNDTYALRSPYHRIAVNETIPADDSCNVYDHGATTFHDHETNLSVSGKKNVKSCPNGWVYDESIMKETATSEFNLVCDRRSDVIQADVATMLGSFFGVVFFGWISTRFGRQASFQSSLVVALISGVLLTWAPNFAVFSIFSSLAAAGTTGMFGASLVLAIELTLPEDRKIPILVMQIFYPLGEVFLSCTSFGFRNWRWMNLTITIPSVLMCSYYWLVPESPRWLIANGRYDKLQNVLLRIARVNRIDMTCTANGEDGVLATSIKSLHSNNETLRIQTDSLLHMFQTRLLCLRSIATFWNWFVVSLIFYGFTLTFANLADPLLAFLLGALVEIPAHVLSLRFVDRCGRKPIHCFYLLTVTVSSAIALCVSSTVEGLTWLVLLFGLIGKFGAAGAMGTSFLWMAEVYPTSVRDKAIGVMGFFIRLGGIAAPYLIRLERVAFRDNTVTFMVFLVVSFFAILIVLSLPETRGRFLPTTIIEASTFGRRERWPSALTVPPAIQDKVTSAQYTKGG